MTAAAFIGGYYWWKKNGISSRFSEIHDALGCIPSDCQHRRLVQLLHWPAAVDLSISF